MPLLHANNLYRYYATGDVFNHVSFSLEPGQRVGLVGPNGGGKSTLVKIIAGLDHANSGRLDMPKNLRIGYQAQTPPEPPTGSLWEHMLEVFAEERAMERELDELSHKMAEEDCPERVITRFSDLQHEFEARDGYSYHHRIETVLTGLGFSPGQYHQDIRILSGGWRTRASLARLLLAQPDILLLDEPTNHLDIDSVRWLEQFLVSYSGAMIVVSHDRFFLDKVTMITWEMDFGTLESYPGNYAKYLVLREARYAERQSQYESQQAYIAETQDFIRRNIAGQRSQEAKGRRKRLERFIEEEAIVEPPHHRKLKASFTAIPRTGDMVLKAADLVVGYAPDKPLVTCKELKIERGDRLAILGANGTGKTTLLRTLVGELAPLAGESTLGANVQIAYFSQTHEGLDLDATLLDSLRSVWPGSTDQQARNLLGSFLFSGDDVFKKVGVLSGGQRSRLALAGLSVSGGNLLVLDEPTNHLDIPTQEVLEMLLGGYPGTMLLVTHDRYLIRALEADVAVVDDGDLRRLENGWDGYLAWRSGESSTPKPDTPAQPAAKPAPTPAKATPAAAKPAPAAQAKPSTPPPAVDYRDQKRRRNELARKQAKYDEVEQMISDMEDEKRMLEHAIGKAGEEQDLDSVHRLSREHLNLEKKLEALISQWTELATELETDA